MIFDEKKHNLKNYSDIWDLSKQSFVLFGAQRMHSTYKNY